MYRLEHLHPDYVLQNVTFTLQKLEHTYKAVFIARENKGFPFGKIQIDFSNISCGDERLQY